MQHIEKRLSLMGGMEYNANSMICSPISILLMIEELIINQGMVARVSVNMMMPIFSVLLMLDVKFCLPAILSSSMSVISFKKKPNIAIAIAERKTMQIILVNSGMLYSEKIPMK